VPDLPKSGHALLAQDCCSGFIAYLSLETVVSKNTRKPFPEQKGHYPNLKVTDKICPNIVLFTGDLVHSGEVSDEFLLAETQFIDPLLTNLALDRSNFLFVPGNHDIQRNKHKAIIDKGLKSHLNSTSTLNEFFDSKDIFSEGYLNKLDNFNNFKEAFSKTDVYFSVHNNLYSTHRRIINDIRIGIGCINSSWLAYGGPEDKEQLLIGERQVDSALNLSIPNNPK
jgi:hypothetical protein